MADQDHDYDVAVIGAGPGGYVCAIRAAQEELSVACVEPRYLGGICLHEGCIPSKALIHAAGLYEGVGELGDYGIAVKADDVALDFGQLMAWKQGVTDRLAGGVKQLFKQNGVDHVQGYATFASSTELSIEPADEAEGDVPDTVTADNVVVATGSAPIELPSLPFDGERVLSSTEALALDAVPERLLVIGGGYIGLELGTVYRKLGSEVTIVELMDQLLPGTEPDLVKVMAKRVKQMGIDVHLGSKATEADVDDDGVTLTVETPDGEATLEGDRVLVTVGRKPNPPPGLDNTKAEVTDKGFLEVDAQRRTADPHVFAVGDVAGEPMLAHKASREGIVAAGAIAGEPVAFDNRAIPAVVFTDPEIAYVGLTEKEAKDKGLDVRVGRFPFAASGRALSTGETEGMVKIVASADGIVLGAQMVGPHVSDLIAEAAFAVEMGATLEDLAGTIHAHPTLPESLMEAAEDAMGEAIHIFRG